ncbi:putative MnhE-like Na(+)/H(+) antiporter subunit E [Candidatus Megaera venefica]|uniref:MnhE-like Na(+)/H(+) antiporter subunit E n=1 Tax=Candidatus Megaera venefica TaxID=2055910 RepID=A0ABU5NAX8_9RICK|nr:Na+/H+ antiporter subunit E [Candidatus Megaera venefica]MEA0970324.1 putative MnhE-like Na(+)/H(+) antiporter subunit E [Candidatus Megaera venefica]
MHIKLVSLLIFMLIWTGLVGFSLEAQHFVYLLAASLLTLIFAIKLKILPQKNLFRISTIFYCLWLLKEIVISALAVSRIAWRKHIILQHSLEPIKTIQTSDVGTLVYANSITLTPGTVTLSVEGKNLLVHALDHDFMTGLQTGEMDKRVKKIVK